MNLIIVDTDLESLEEVGADDWDLNGVTGWHVRDYGTGMHIITFMRVSYGNIYFIDLDLHISMIKPATEISKKKLELTWFTKLIEE